MQRYHEPNPLDRLFLAMDEAWRRCGLAGMDMHAHLEFDGPIDVDGLHAALGALHRRFPATAARLVRKPLSRRPAWRLDPGGAAVQRLVRTETLEPPGADALRARLEALLRERIDYRREPPLHLHVLRGAAPGDVLVVRWPHAFADARGGVTLIEELARLYDDADARDRATSAGDERRRDFGALPLPGNWLSAARRWLRRADVDRPPNPWNEVRLCPPAFDARNEPPRMFVRKLDSDQMTRVREASLRVAGFARLADFLRAGVVRAVDDVAGRPRGPHDGYTTLHIVENRRKRDPGPVCHNVFSTVPVHVPANLAQDRRAVSDLIRDRTLAAMGAGLFERRLAGLTLLGALPLGLVGRMMARSRRGRGGRLPLGLSSAPSAPLGFIGGFAEPHERMFGARLLDIYGIPATSPRAGFTLNVNVVADRMNVAGVYLPSQMPEARVELLVDRFVDAIVDPTP